MIYKALITGGTGTIGTELAQKMKGHEVTIFSRNEEKQVLMKRQNPELRYILGDIRDYSEVLRATEGMQYVFHFAAIKHVDICEKQPSEAIKTNVLGTMNIINACHYWGCRLINMSSDKAINPMNVYGRTKALCESMINQMGYVSIRSGNVLWSSGSVLRIWERQLAEQNCINLTSTLMTRFFIHPAELAQFILDKMDCECGTYTVPMRSFRLIDIAREFILRFGNVDSKINITYLRPGERVHEFRDENISSEDNVCNDLNYIFR
jgi:FlaA1/EpsC-like NDP-sugar epimerase